MHSVSTGLARRAHVLGRVEVRPHLHDDISGARMQGTPVVRCHDRNCLKAFRPAGAKDPHRDLAAIRYQQRRSSHAAPQLESRAGRRGSRALRGSDAR